MARLWLAATRRDTDEAERRSALRHLIDLAIEIDGTAEARYPEAARSALAARVDELRALNLPP